MSCPRSELPLLLLAVVLTAVGVARAESCGPFDPADDSDAVMPAGIEAVRWGMSPLAVEALRGQAMERYPDPQHENVFQLHELIRDDEAPIVAIRYTFFDDKLIEVRLYLRPDFLDLAESQLLAPYTGQYGGYTHKETVYDPLHRPGRATAKSVLAKKWTWCDRFTQIELLRDLEGGEVIMHRISRMLAAELASDLEERHERDTWNAVRELPID